MKDMIEPRKFKRNILSSTRNQNRTM